MGAAERAVLVPARERGIIPEVLRALPEHEMPEQRSPLKVFRALEEKLKTAGLSPDEQARYDQLKEIVSSEAAAAPPGRDAAAELRPFDLSTLALDEVEAAFDAAMVPLDELKPGRDSAAPGPDAPVAAGGAAPEAGPWVLGAGTGPLGRAPGPALDPQGAVPEHGADAPGFDLGPAAFDAAALPPEPSQGAGNGVAWDTAALPDLAEGDSTPEPGLVEAELIEGQVGAEPIEVEQGGQAPPGAEPAPPEAPGSNLFAAGLPEPDAGGEQPLDAATFAEAEPALDPEESSRREAGAAAPGGDRPVSAEEPFQPDLAGGPETSDAGEPPALELTPESLGEPGAVEVAPPPAGAGDSISHLDLASPPVEPPPAAGGLEDLEIEEMPAVDVDLDELAEPAGPAPGGGGASPTFVPGEHRVLVQTVEGRVLRGTLTDVDLDASALPLVSSPGAAPELITPSRVRAIFFMLLPGGRAPTPEGYKVRVTFRDGKQMAGFSTDDDPGASGFFIVPAESRTGTGRIWIYRRAVQRVSVS